MVCPWRLVCDMRDEMPVPRSLIEQLKLLIPPLNGTLHKGQAGHSDVYNTSITTDTRIDRTCRSTRRCTRVGAEISRCSTFHLIKIVATRERRSSPRYPRSDLCVLLYISHAYSTDLLQGADLSHVVCAPTAAGAIKSYSPDLIVHPILREDV